MELTSRLCRAQEAAQRERAASTTLENVRLAAERAATAWRQAAVEAEQCEARRARRERLPRSLFCKSKNLTKMSRFSARIQIAAEHRFESI